MDVRQVLSELEARADPERRRKAASYFPSALEVYGVPVPRMREVLRPIARRLKHEPVEVVLAVARALVSSGVHEARQLAYELWAGAATSWLRSTERPSKPWGAGTTIGLPSTALACISPARPGGTAGFAMPTCGAGRARRTSWWRRTALVCTVALNVKARGGDGDAHRTLQICSLLVSDRDPVVVKALSWALRALAPVDRDVVASFLRRHERELSRVVLREVETKLETGRKTRTAGAGRVGSVEGRERARTTGAAPKGEGRAAPKREERKERKVPRRRRR